MSEPQAIFVVGVSRSGTTLMRSILNSHRRIAIATENHYLGHLLPWEGARVYFRRVGNLRNDEVVARLVTLIYSDGFQGRSRLRELSPYWRWLTGNVDRDELERRLLVSDRSERAVFEVFLRLYADHRGKDIPGEKTPAHLAYVDMLMMWFPDARVVHMMRDPRAVYVSEVRRRMERPEGLPYRWLIRLPLALRAFVMLQVCWVWALAVRRHGIFATRYPGRYRAVRFENLVTRPQETLDDLCAFLGVPMEPQLLAQRVRAKGSLCGYLGFDAGAASRWRESIGAGEARLIALLLGERLGRSGYQR